MNSPTNPNRRPQRQVGPSDELTLRVALALLDDARRRGAFETDAKALAARTAELEAEFTESRTEWNSDSEPTVQASPVTAEEINLSTTAGDLVVRFASLRLDGVLHRGGVAFGVSLDAVSEAELSPSELEQVTQLEAEPGMPPKFRGGRFRGAVPAPLQPGSEIQILATELFDDGLIVHASFNREAESLEDAGSIRLSWRPGTDLSVEDDIGTEYHAMVSSEGGGAQVAHQSVVFAPAVPADARVLRVISRKGAVELAL